MQGYNAQAMVELLLGEDAVLGAAAADAAGSVGASMEPVLDLLADFHQKLDFNASHPSSDVMMAIARRMVPALPPRRNSQFPASRKMVAIATVHPPLADATKPFECISFGRPD